MDISLKQVAELLLSNDNILILSHKSPDGDTTGSAFALYHALKSLGKNACVGCADEFPKKYSYMQMEEAQQMIDFDFIVTVDVADLALIGSKFEHLKEKIDLRIDHHLTGASFAKHNYVDIKSASNCEIMYDLLKLMNVKLNSLIANSVYTGVISDTGLFKFSNTTARTHRIAAELFEHGCEYEMINRLLFEVKTKNRILVERSVLDNLEFYHNNQIVVLQMPTDLISELGIDEGELEGIAAISRQVEGAEVGITIKKRDESSYKISLRSSDIIDSSEVCRSFGGGGHKRAAGCMLEGKYDEVKNMIITQVIKAMESK